MNEFIILIIVLVIGLALSGLAALIISIVALNKTNELFRRIQAKELVADETPAKKAVGTPIPKTISTPPPPPPTAETQWEVKEKPLPQIIKPPEIKTGVISIPKIGTLEQRIGTRWILIAGVVAIFVGVAFFLRYAIDNFSIGPLGRVIAVAAGGLIALTAGEITRRRGYEIVAKGVTALGFAVLYAAVFTTSQLYGLIGTAPAFILAIIITASAMAYAVTLNEIVMAFLSLLGGFLTPVIVSTSQNLPIPLFSYTLTLGVGAILCGYYRKWRTVNLLAFAGTFLLYTSWFEKFYRPDITAIEPSLSQMPMALGWLGIFFLIYLVMPILYELVNKKDTHKEDVMLMLFNAIVTFYYLHAIFFESHQSILAFCTAGLAAAHLIMMAVAMARCRDDKNLQMVLLAIALVFITVAVPLYWKMCALTMAWAIQAIVLTVIGLRYKSVLTQFSAIVTLLLSCGNLLIYLPMHTEAFRLFINPTFGTWCVVASATCICHILYRNISTTTEELHDLITQLLYTAAGLLLFAATTMEWYWHCHYNLMTPASIHFISRGQILIFAGIILFFIIGPIRQRTQLTQAFTMIMTAVGTIFTAYALIHLHKESFTIFFNLDFMIVLAFITAMLICHIKYRHNTESTDNAGISQIIYGLLGSLFLLIVTAEWYWHYKLNLSSPHNTTLLKGQVIIFAVILQLFVLRPICPRGTVPKVLACIIAFVASVFTMIVFTEFYKESFTIFANIEFAVVIIFVAALFLAALLSLKSAKSEKETFGLAITFALTAVFVLWILLTEEIWLYWYCRNKYAAATTNWTFLAHMYISVAWAVYGAILMIIGFIFKKRTLRFIAIGLFALLLGKVFILDMGTVKSVFRIAAFLATGITLVGVSYLYQHLKNKGFFEVMLAEKTQNQ